MKGKSNDCCECIIIGGGAAGLFCAAFGFEPSATGKRLIIEATSRPGTKLMMSGGGHCNVTHAGSIKDFIDCYNAGRSIRKCLYKHNNLELMELLSAGGVEVKAEDDGRVFPVSGRAADVRDLLLRKARSNGFEIVTNSRVTAINCSENSSYEITCGSSEASGRTAEIKYCAGSLVIATGGCSYPATGSDGSMFGVLERDLGIESTALRPALCPVYVTDYPYGELSGISLEVRIRSGKRSRIGSMLFTSDGMSGPVVLNMSGDLSDGDAIEINYIYPRERDAAAAELQKAVTGSGADLSNIIAETFKLPKRFSRVIAARAGASTKTAASILTGDRFTVSRHEASAAMVTRGGVALSQIDLATMEVRLYRDLYIIGEALDVDGCTGGYNLQFAYSSARAAADAITEKSARMAATEDINNSGGVIDEL